MAVTFDNNTSNYLELTGASAPSTDPYTVMFWMYFNSVANGRGVFSRGPSPEVYVYDTKLYWQGPNFYGTTVLSVDTWYHLAFTRTGVDREMFVNGVSDGTGTGGTPGDFYLGYHHANDGRLEAFKHFDVVLTQADIEQDMYFNVPVRTVNLERWSHFTTPDNVNFRDYSGSGAADWVERGTLTQGNPGPPITWRKGASKIFVPAAAAEDISHVAALADSFDNVVQRRPIKITNF